MTWRGNEVHYPSILTCTVPYQYRIFTTRASSAILLFRPFSHSFLGGGSVDVHSFVDFLWACDAKPVPILSLVVIARGFGICLGLTFADSCYQSQSQSPDADRP
ncbi:hypothetical protein HDV64DRAFT_205571 [Trichoderma sp. TUCIM 5745]